ncbi:hypothetical protein H5410_052578, partial [Solanum commersonii]
GASVVFRWGFVGWLFEVGELVVWWSFVGCFSLGDRVGGLFNVVQAWNWPEMEKKGLAVVTGK